MFAEEFMDYFRRNATLRDRRHKGSGQAWLHEQIDALYKQTYHDGHDDN